MQKFTKFALSFVIAFFAIVANAQTVLVNYEGTAELPNGVAISGTTAMANVKINTNSNGVNCIQLANGYTSDSKFNGNAITLTTEGGFKAGDVLSVTGFFNNSTETKVSKVDLITVDADNNCTVVWTSEQFINGRTVADDPTAQTYTLEEDMETIILGRNGNTGTNIWKLSVTRTEEEPVASVSSVVLTAEGTEGCELIGHAESVEAADGIMVRFDGIVPLHATYAIDAVDHETGDVIYSVTSGELNNGYASFDETKFVSAYHYIVTLKAWAGEMFDENFNVNDPALTEVYTFIGSNPSGIVGEPQFGVERGQFPEEMANLGVPVSISEVILPTFVDLNAVEATISATLYGVPTGNEPMPISGEEELGDENMGVDGPVVIAEAVPVTLTNEGGEWKGYLFPEQLEVGNHYAIDINAVTFMYEGEIVAELPEDAYYAVDFDVVPTPVVPTLGEIVWGLENIDYEARTAEFPEDMVMLGVPVSFPDIVLPTELEPAELTVTVSASLYGIPTNGDIMPLSGEENVGDENNGVDGPVAIVEAQLHNGTIDASGLHVSLFPEMLEVYNHYGIIINAITVENGENVVLEYEGEGINSPEIIVVPAAGELVLGEAEININGMELSATDVEAYGIVLSFPFAENVPEDVEIKVVADLAVPVPGFGGNDEVDGGFGAPNFQVALENVEFVGGVDELTGVLGVAMPEFVQYISEAGAGVYQIIVKSIVANDVDVYNYEDETVEPIGAVFAVVETFEVEATATVAQTAADQWGDQHYQVIVTVENSDNEVSAAGVAYAYTEGVIFYDESTWSEFTFNCEAIEGVAVNEDEDVVLTCTDAMASQTTDPEFEGELRAEGTYPAHCVVVLVAEDGAEVGTARYNGELTLSKTVTGINAHFVVKNVDVKYNLAGQRVNNANGIVIMNGKKFINK